MKYWNKPLLLVSNGQRILIYSPHFVPEEDIGLFPGQRFFDTYDAANVVAKSRAFVADPNMLPRLVPKHE